MKRWLPLLLLLVGAAPAHGDDDRVVEWQLPAERPALAQGAVAGLPVKVLCEDGRLSLFVQSVFAYELAAALAHLPAGGAP